MDNDFQKFLLIRLEYNNFKRTYIIVKDKYELALIHNDNKKPYSVLARYQSENVIKDSLEWVSRYVFYYESVSILRFLPFKVVGARCRTGVYEHLKTLIF